MNACELPNTGARFVKVVVTASSSKANATENPTKVVPRLNGDLPTHSHAPRFVPGTWRYRQMHFGTSASAAAISIMAPSKVPKRFPPSAAIPTNSTSITGRIKRMMSTAGE